MKWKDKVFWFWWFLGFIWNLLGFAVRFVLENRLLPLSLFACAVFCYFFAYFVGKSEVEQK